MKGWQIRILFLAVVFIFGGTTTYAQKNAEKDFTDFLQRLDAAQLELQNGKAEAFKNL